VESGKSWRQLVKKRKGGEEQVLSCLASAYWMKKKKELVMEEAITEPYVDSTLGSLPVTDGSVIQKMMDMIRSLKLTRTMQAKEPKSSLECFVFPGTVKGLDFLT